MRLDYRNGRYLLAADMTPLDTSTRTKVIADLKEHGASTPAEIGKRTGIERKTVQEALLRMKGLAKRAGEGRWSLEPVAEALV